MSSKAVKKSVDKPVTPGSLVPARHGGSIRHGSLPGNTPGTGRPASEVRARALGSFDDRLPVLEEIADNKRARRGDRIAAVVALGKIGLSDTVSRADVRKALAATVEDVRQALPSIDAEALVQQIRSHWMTL